MDHPIRTIKLSAPAAARFWEIPVLYLDDSLLALDKPVGLPLLPLPGTPAEPALLPLLHEAIKQEKPWARALGLTFLINAHRLESQVSGVLLFARSKPVLTLLNDLFGSEKPMLQFDALAQGNPDREDFEQDIPLLPEPDLLGKYRISRRDGKRARTHFRVLERFGSHTLLECEPFTHRPHQVRAHLSKLGYPLAGDCLYGGGPLLLSRIKPGFHLKPGHSEKPLLGRPALHAKALRLTHPLTAEPLVITAPLPHDFEAALKYLRRYRSLAPRAEVQPPEA